MGINKKWREKRRPDDVPVIADDTEDMYAILSSMNAYLIGTGFAIAVRNDDGVIEVWPRQAQPCQGGEMRKYGASHDDSTRPNDNRPGDLHYPFPDGQPLALSVPMNRWGWNTQYAKMPYEDVETYLKLLYGDDSPWVAGIGSSDNVSWTRNDQMKINGIVLQHVEVDPTVLVNLLRFSRQAEPHAKSYKTFIEAGFSPREAVSMVGNNIQILHPKPFVGDKSWYNSNNFERMLKQNPRNISNGTLADRYDYNRPEIDSLWADHTKASKNFQLELYTRLGAKFNDYNEFKPERVVEVAREVLGELRAA